MLFHFWCSATEVSCLALLWFFWHDLRWKMELIYSPYRHVFTYRKLIDFRSLSCSRKAIISWWLFVQQFLIFSRVFQRLLMKLCLFIISGENCYKKVNFHSVPFIVQTLFVCALIARWSKKLCFLCYLHLGKSLLSFAEAEAASEYFVCPPLFWIIFVIKRLFSAFASEAER